MNSKKWNVSLINSIYPNQDIHIYFEFQNFTHKLLTQEMHVDLAYEVISDHNSNPSYNYTWLACDLLTMFKIALTFVQNSSSIINPNSLVIFILLIYPIFRIPLMVNLHPVCQENIMDIGGG
jgi:hypothetical protein